MTKRSTSDNPKEVCIRYTKGKCMKSHAECPFVHNPTCIWYARGRKCSKGTKCLFPHRSPQSRNQHQIEDQVALQLGIDDGHEESFLPWPREPLTKAEHDTHEWHYDKTILRCSITGECREVTGLSNAADFTETENIRNKVVKEDGDIPHEWHYPCQNLEDDVQDAARMFCRACNRDISTLNQIQCHNCTFIFCGTCVWFCAECLLTTCRGGECACNCRLSDNYDSEQDTLRELRDIQELRSPSPEEYESEDETEAEAKANAEAAVDESK